MKEIGTYKVNATYTKEMADELMAFHSIDAVAELSKLLAEEINTEMIKRIIDDYEASKSDLEKVTDKIRKEIHGEG